MKTIKIIMSLFFFLAVSGIKGQSHSMSISQVSGLRLHMPGFESYKSSFLDPAGNHLFIFSSGKNFEQGDAWVLKMSADGSDTTMRCFALRDTVAMLYTGYYTSQNSYMFFGQIMEDTVAYLSSFCYLWVLETDLSLNVIQSKRIKIPLNYNAISKISGFSLSEGKFTAIGLYTAPPTTWYSDDLFLVQFDSNGDTIKTKVFNNSLHEQLHFVRQNTDPSCFSAIIFGLNVNFPEQRMVIDSNMNYQIHSFIGWPDIQGPLNFMWLNDTLLMAGGVKHQPPTRWWDMHVCVADTSGNFYQDLYFGNKTTFDQSAYYQSVIRSADSGYYFAGMLSVEHFETRDTMMFCRINENYTPDWTKYYSGSENFLVQEIFLKPDGNILAAATYFDLAQPQYGRDLIFFTVDSSAVPISGIDDYGPVQTGVTYTLLPNPGSDFLQLEANKPGQFFVRLLDFCGREVVSSNSLTTKGVINTNNILPGLYFVELIRENKTRTLIKWIKNE